MTSAQDPFYIVKEEIQDSIDKLESTFHKWEFSPSETGERALLTRELLTNCDSIEWQVEELDKAIAVAAREPARYGIDEAELERRRRWTTSAHKQVATVRKAAEAGKGKNISLNGTRQELVRIPNDRSNDYITQDDEDFISSESDRQMLLIKRQDEELDELSLSVQKIGGIGLTIHEELVGQERILDELSTDMETTANRLDFVQKKITVVMKKAGVKGQIMIILFLIILFIILFVLVFLT
ncbi:syntaxin-61-like [Phalaenopsis equestris]|uniref:syntaxin-61-like n=1 Tax=Phalaenopsis equestris TaxID=78828 RepID=UPI0009E1C692|nr:syntaxin-61-like [Phalaenopsis equestris]XP_020589257.1 syntaxin-61-like [Phalaenopsis equestris]XP_020589258.1 syntaxin-61-like [Phalaenopsis equestris]